jgi:hypothetical protein
MRIVSLANRNSFSRPGLLSNSIIFLLTENSLFFANDPGTEAKTEKAGTDDCLSVPAFSVYMNKS